MGAHPSRPYEPQSPTGSDQAASTAVSFGSQSARYEALARIASLAGEVIAGCDAGVNVVARHAELSDISPEGREVVERLVVLRYVPLRDEAPSGSASRRAVRRA